jgi:DNA-binding protein H-NS
MSSPDLETLSLSELKQLQKDVARAIASFEERQKAEARSKVEAIAREMGFSLEELLGGEPKAKRGRRTTSAAKYRHPENATLTWSGRGRKPKWFTDAVEAGTSADSLLIG